MFHSQKKYLFEVPSSIVFDRKLDTALRQSTVSSFYHRRDEKRHTYDDTLITESKHYLKLDNDFKTTTSISTLAYTDILDSIFLDTDNGILYDRNDHASSFRYNSMAKTFRIQLQNVLKNYELPNRANILLKAEQFLGRNKESMLVRNLLHVADDLNSMIERSHEINARRLHALSPAEKLKEQLKINFHMSSRDLFTMVWSQKLCLITTNRTSYIMPRPYILLIHNKICDLISVLVLSKAQSGAALPLRFDTVVIRFIRSLMVLHYEYDKDFYKIIKSLEALCIGENIRELDSWDNDEFIVTLSKELKKSPGFNYLRSQIRNILISCDAVARHELCCLTKLLGHPLVDMLEGSISLNKKTNEPYTLNPVRIVESTNYMKENYIRNHIAKKGRWPPVSIDSKLCPAALKQAWILDVDPMSPRITKKYGITKIDHYIFINIEKRLEFNRLENALPYLKDKTISVMRNEVISSYIEHNQETSKSSWKETRLLLYYLLNTSDVTDHVSFLKKYEASKDFEDLLDYFVLRIVPKEKELKEAYRGFGCQTYFQRMRCLAQEKNAMLFLDLFSDEQAMTLSELELIKKLYALRTITRAYKDHIAIYINIDASSWNNHFRSQTVDYPMMSFLDKVFDTKIFSKTHQSYENTLFYVPDEEQTFFWFGQGGGIEGLNQDTWVLDYINQLKLSMAKFGYKYHLWVKGDDARIIALIGPKSLETRTIAEIKTDIVEELHKVAAEFGHDIKIEDSYGSCCYFTFSKASAYKTIQFPQTLRKIQKCYGSNNAMLPTLDDYIGSTFSNAHSACHESSNVLPCYWVALFWACWYLSIHPSYKGMSNDMITALMMVPSIVGGFPIIFMHNMFVRAESDLLSPFLDLVCFCRQNYSTVYRWMCNFCRIPTTPEKSIIMLCKDPYSLPSDRPELPTAYMRRSIIPILRRSVVNEDIQKMFKSYDSDVTKKVLVCLQSSSVYNPRLMSAIYSCTPAAIVEELVRKFESARSIHELHIMRQARGRADRMLKAVITREFTLQKWRSERLQGKNLSRTKSFALEITECPTDTASRVRFLAWGKIVEGLVSPPVAHQIKITSPLSSSDMDWDHKNSFLLNFHPPTEYIPRTCNNVNWSTAGKVPFLGKETSPSHLAPIVHLLEKDPIMSKIKTLIELHSWTNVEALRLDGTTVRSNLPEVIEFLLKCYTDENINKLQKFGPSKRSGTIQHHLGSPRYRASIVPNTLSNIYQLFTGDSYHHQLLSSATDHFNMNFLYIFCHGIVLSMFETNFSPDITLPSQIWLTTRNCIHCIQPIFETPIVCETDHLMTSKVEMFFNTELAKRTLRHLKRAILEYDDEGLKDLPVETDISIEHASYGILQEIFDETKRSQSRLVDRYTQHALGPGGIDVLSDLQARIQVERIPDRILLNIPVRYIVSSIIQLVFYELQEMIKEPDARYIGVQISPYPTNTLPWYHILDRLYHAGLLPSVILELERISRHPSGTASINTAHAANYVAHVSYSLALEWSTFLPSVYLSYYSLDRYLWHYKRTLSLTFQGWRRKAFDTLLNNCNEAFSKGHILDITRNSVLTLLGKYYLIMSVDYLDEDYLKEIWDSVKENSRTLVSFVSLANLDEEVIGGDFHDDQRRRNGYYKLRKLYRNLPWSSVEDYTLRNWDLIYEEANHFCQQFQVEIINTTLQDCLYIIETYRNPLPDFEDEDGAYTFSDPVTYPNPRPLKHPTQLFTIIPFNRRYGIEHVGYPVSETWEDDKIILDPSIMYRPLGHTTMVFSRLTELWSFFRLPFPSKNAHNVLVLGDGVGNTSSFMCNACQNSNIYITTLPQGGARPFVSEMTQSAASTNQCKIIVSHYRENIYDVCDPRFLPYFKSYNAKYQYFISDIEYPKPDDNMHLQLYKSIIEVFLELRAHRSMAIIQVRLDEARVVNYVLQTLGRFCESVGIVKLQSSTRHQQAYIFAYGNRDVYIRGMLDDGLSSHQTMKCLENFLKRAREKTNSWINNRSRSVTIMRDDWQPYVIGLFRLPFRLTYQLYKRYKVHVDLSTFISNMDRQTSFMRVLSSFKLGWLDRQIDEGMTYIASGVHAEIRANHSHLDTHIHVIKTYEQVLCCQGYTDTYLFLSLNPDVAVSDLMIRQSYRDRIKNAPTRLQIPPFGPSHFKDPLRIHEIKTHFFRYYHLGSCLALETARLFYHCYKNAPYGF